MRVAGDVARVVDRRGDDFVLVRTARISARGLDRTQSATIFCSVSLLAMRARFVAYRSSAHRSGRPMARNSRRAIVWFEAAIDSQPPSPDS